MPFLLSDALQLYSATGESSSSSSNASKLYQEAVEQKQKESLHAAAQLVERCPSVAEHKERRDQEAEVVVYSPLQKIAMQPTVDTPLLLNTPTASLQEAMSTPLPKEDDDGDDDDGVELTQQSPTPKDDGEVSSPNRTLDRKDDADDELSPPPRTSARKRGRPKGSSKPLSSRNKGRPRKSKNQLPEGVQPDDYIQRRIAKFFGDEESPFLGTVISYNPDTQFWKIQYDDMDEEEMEYHELAVQLQCFAENEE